MGAFTGNAYKPARLREGRDPPLRVGVFLGIQCLFVTGGASLKNRDENNLPPIFGGYMQHSSIFFHTAVDFGSHGHERISAKFSNPDK